MKTISTTNAPAAIGPYAQGNIAGGLLFASGQIPLDPETGEIVGSTIEEQTAQVMKNVAAIPRGGRHRLRPRGEDDVLLKRHERLRCLQRRVREVLRRGAPRALGRGGREAPPRARLWKSK